MTTISEQFERREEEFDESWGEDNSSPFYFAQKDFHHQTLIQILTGLIERLEGMKKVDSFAGLQVGDISAYNHALTDSIDYLKAEIAKIQAINKVN